MGQQQLLLIILGVIVVGIAVVVGISMFKDNAISSNRDAVVNDLVYLGGRAQQYYRRPVALGGGQGSYAGILQIDKLSGPVGGTSWTNGNGTYTVTSQSQDQVVINGKGRENAGPGVAVEVNCYVGVAGNPDSLWTVVVQ